MAKTKLISSSTPKFLDASKGHMIGRQHVGTQTPGQSASMPQGSGGSFIQGGGSAMGVPQKAQPAVAGRSGRGREDGSSSGSGGGRVTKAMGKS